MTAPQDLRQKLLLECFPNLTLQDQKSVLHSADTMNQARRIETAVREGVVKTPSYLPDFFEKKDYIKALQLLVVHSIRGYFSEHQRGAGLDDIYSRVLEKIRVLRQDEEWPHDWKTPRKRTVDRRVNEVASPNPEENLVMENGVSYVIALKAGLYIPSPALFEDVARIVKGAQP